MLNQIVPAGLPCLPVRLELSPELYGRPGLRAAVVPAVAKAMTELSGNLGIPARPEIGWEPNDEKVVDARPVVIFTNGRLCRYSDDLMLRLYSYVSGKVLMPRDALRGMEAWLIGGEQELVAEWLALLTMHACGAHPSVLLGPDQARAYCATLDLATGRSTAAPQRLAPILRSVLDLGLSLSNYAQVAAAVEEGGRDDDSVVEALISKLRPDRIELRMERSYLRALSLSEGARGPEMFKFLREGLFVELGVSYPPIRVIVDDRLRPGGFAVTINHLPGAPLIGLPLNCILVNDIPERMADVATEPVSNPATYLPGATAARLAQEPLEARSLTTWDALQFLILCVASELRVKNARFVDSAATRHLVEVLGMAFPELAQASKAHLSFDQLTAVLRGLAAEQISIRNLRRILELLLEYEFCVRSGGSRAEWMGYVRLGLAGATAHKLKKDGPAVVVYLLEAEAEQGVLNTGNEHDTDVTRRLINGIRAELENVPPTATWPAILTAEAVATLLRTIIADELPRMRVLSYGQAPPDLNIDAVARIGLEGERLFA